MAMLFFFAICAGSANDGMAQNSADGSVYSRFGIGELQTFSSSQAQAMGNSGYGLHSLNYINLSNPATWSDQILTRASAGFTYQNLRISDASDVQSRLATGYLDGIQFSFPLLERRLGVALGFVPYSRVNYRVRDERVMYPQVPAPDTVTYAIDFEGSGGIQQLVGGLGYRINNVLSVGASVSGLFGIVENGRRTSFIQSARNAQYTETQVAAATRLTGITATVGSFVSTRRVLGQDDFLTFGAAFTLPAQLAGTRVRTLGETLDRDTLGTAVKGDVQLPWSASAGVAYYPNARWTITAGGRYEPWTNFESDFVFPGEELSNRVQAGLGVEFIPAGNELLAPYFARVAYRIGFLYDKSYISPLAGADLRTIALTGGLSLPTLMSGTRLDMNFQVGTRGETENNLLRDVFYRLSVNVNIGERWFQTPKLR